MIELTVIQHIKGVIEMGKKKETCEGCKHLSVKDIWRGMMTASCVRDDDDGLIIPHHWDGESVTITGKGKFCKGKEVK